MAVFFIIVSLMLNILLIFAVVLLYMRQNKLFGMEDTQKRTLKEMEELISTYLIEMKEENEQFINRVKEINKKNSESHSSETTFKSSDDFNRSVVRDIKQEEPLSNRLGKTVSLHAVKAYQKQKHEVSINTMTHKPFISDSPNKKENSKNSTEENSKNSTEENSTINANESLIDQLLTLKEKGLTKDELAKKFNKGKTEIELLLKFQEKR